MCVIENREIKGIFLRKWIIAQSDVIRCRFTTFYTFFPRHCFVVVHIKTWSVTLLLEAWQIYYLGPTSTCVNYEILVPCRARVRWRQRTLVGAKFYAAWRFTWGLSLFSPLLSLSPFIIKHAAAFYLRMLLVESPGKLLRATIRPKSLRTICHRRNGRDNKL